MKVTFLLAAGLAASTGAAAESPQTETCRKDADERFIEVVAPGTVGAACDVVYRRGDEVTVPYNANADANFCRARAAELAASLTADGFVCSTASSDAVEAALAGGPSTVAAASETLPLNEQLQILNQPAAVARTEPLVDTPETVAGPVHLATDIRPIEYRAPRPSSATGAGRLVGAQPSLDDIILATTEPQPAAAPPASDLPVRPTEDIVRGVVAATAAAWNEGNLSAFMAAYADSPVTTATRDGVVVTGWSHVKKLQEQDIEDAGAMGRLNFAELAVTFSAPDVVSVAGQYSLTRPAAPSKGAVTLVLKQTDGRWRIVEDTRVADAPGTE